MTDQPPVQFTLTFSLPDEWLVEHWERYTNARAAYQEQCDKAGKTANSVVTDFMGAMELVSAGIVHINTNVDLVKIALAPGFDRSKANLTLMGIFVVNIARPLEAAINIPLSIWLSKLSPSALTQNDTQSPAL
jgi:hypothetical protein